MKRTISMLMILTLLLGGMSAFAQDEKLDIAEMEAAEEMEILEDEVQEIYDIHGEVLEITEEYILIDTADMGYVQVNLSEDTVIEGVQTLEIGQTAVVMYDGMMTRSLPPQINALHIGVYAVSGVITEVLEDRIVIMQDGTGEEIVLMLPGNEDLGENEELIEEEILAAQEEAEAEDAEEISEEALIESDETDAEEAGSDEEEAAIEEELSEDAPVFAVGDAIIAYTNGTMTMSLPPQMTALTIVFAPQADETEMVEISEEAEETAEESEAAEADETVG